MTQRDIPTPPERTDDVASNALQVCAEYGHTEHNGVCLVCYRIVGEPTVDDVITAGMGV